jgi:hypothetical protein
MNADTVADRINKSYTKEFNSINAAVDAADEDDDLALRRCCMRARALLAEPTMPLYHRIKTLLLLASIVGMSSSHYIALDCFAFAYENKQTMWMKRLLCLGELKRR